MNHTTVMYYRLALFVLILGSIITYMANQNITYKSPLGERINEGICHRMGGIYSTETRRCTKGVTNEKK